MWIAFSYSIARRFYFRFEILRCSFVILSRSCPSAQEYQSNSPPDIPPARKIAEYVCRLAVKDICYASDICVECKIKKRIQFFLWSYEDRFISRFSYVFFFIKIENYHNNAIQEKIDVLKQRIKNKILFTLLRNRN